MAHAWIEDRWLKDTASSAERRSLNSARIPDKAKVAEENRTAAFGTGKRWVVYWMEPLPGGSLKRRNKRFSSKAEAESWRTQVDDDIRSNRYIDKASAQHTVSQAADIWFEKRVTVAPGTLRGQRLIYERRIKPRWGNAAVGSITPLAVELWGSDLLNGSAPGRKHPLTPGSIQNIRNVFNQILDVAIQCRWVNENAGRKAKWPKVKSNNAKRLVILSTDQVTALAKACDRIVNKKTSEKSTACNGLFILFLTCTGLRIGEAAALRVGDIDRFSWTVSVTKTRSTGKDGCIWSAEGPTKNGIDRIVPIPSMLHDRLTDIMAGRRANDFLFHDADGCRLNYIAWRHSCWLPAVTAAGLNGINKLSPHALRHTYASMLIANGTDVKTVQRLMGHANATMTLDTYAALWPGNEQTAVDKLNQMWKI